MNTKKQKCKQHGFCKHYKDITNSQWRCKKCNVHRVTLFRRRRKEKLVKLFGGKCQRCGYDKCVAALEFHHRNPSEKCFGLSASGITRSYDKVLEEAKKCDLLCANCHREVEYQKFEKGN